MATCCLIIVSIGLGVLIILFGRNLAFPVDELFEGFNELMMIVTNWVIAISPIGIFWLHNWLQRLEWRHLFRY